MEVNKMAIGEVGGLFVGIGVLALLSVLTYLFYQITKAYRSIMESVIREQVVNDVLLEKVCAKRGIDLNKEMIKRDFLRTKEKRLMKKIREEMYDEFFSEKTEKKK